jgi:hypothetical protein
MLHFEKLYWIFKINLQEFLYFDTKLRSCCIWFLCNVYVIISFLIFTTNISGGKLEFLFVYIYFVLCFVVIHIW